MAASGGAEILRKETTTTVCCVYYCRTRTDVERPLRSRLTPAPN